MLIIKDRFKVEKEDKILIEHINKNVKNADKLTATECSTVHHLWDKYPLDSWVDGSICSSILTLEMREWKGRRQCKERAKLTMLIWLCELPQRPTLEKVFSTLGTRTAYQAIFKSAYNYKR